MAINLDNFVKITIKYHEANKITGVRDTAVLFDNSISKDCVITSLNGNTATLSDNSTLDLSEYANKNYIEVFFNNGGDKIHVVKAEISANEIAKLDEKEILIASVGTSLSDINNIAKTITSSDGINEKIIVTSNSDETNVSDISTNNLVVKIGSAGIEMATLAYYTRLDIYNSEVKDYAFTSEVVKDSDLITSNTTLNSILNKQLNCNIKLAGKVVNVGGNTTGGLDLTNLFTKIVLVQTLSDRLINLLISKIKYNQSGLTKVSSVLNTELSKYRANGYLTTNKSWTDEDLYYKDNLVISQGEPLPLGYKFIILPFSTLTAEEISAHQLPEIYLILAEGYSIRKIVITGEVF